MSNWYSLLRKSWEVVGWSHEGVAYCAKHKPEQGSSPDEPMAIFLDQLETDCPMFCEAAGCEQALQ